MASRRGNVVPVTSISDGLAKALEAAGVDLEAVPGRPGWVIVRDPDGRAIPISPFGVHTIEYSLNIAGAVGALAELNAQLRKSSPEVTDPEGPVPVSGPRSMPPDDPE